MQADQVNELFARAERAFMAGRLDAARADLLQVQRSVGDHPALLHLTALVEKKRGALEAARSAFQRALRLSPNDPQINNNFANLLELMGELGSALTHFERALAASPRFADARYNRALLLQRLDRLDEALAELDTLVAASPATAKLHSARAGVLRQFGRLAEAAEAYEEALRLDPERLVALHGRARTALERGEANASAQYRRALEKSPNDLALQLGLAEALEAEGEGGAAESLSEAVRAMPTWAEGQAALARMRWEAGEGRAFTRGFEEALREHRGDPALWFAYASSLAGVDLHKEAADVAARARRIVGDNQPLMLLEALHSSEAGELDRADYLFERLRRDLPGRSIHETRHLIRRKRFEEALASAEKALAEEPWHVGAWGMKSLLWRVMGDDRAAWLHGQEGLVATSQLRLTAEEIATISERLRNLHRTRAHPIGQSLRGGTQTRGRLFERQEPEIVLLQHRIVEALDDYWDALPARDDQHPLLRHRDRRPRIEGAWSVRLTGGGFHVAHIHPNGILSSACYLVTPDAVQPRQGWLQIGRPPPELGLELGPLAEVEPAPGRMALFPSTLFHGTVPFQSGERITAAFDVVAA